MGSYGVATQNPFGLLDNENEDPQLLAAAVKVAPAVKPAKKEAVKEEPKSQGSGCRWSAPVSRIR
jgi:hypothetical protein